MYGYVLIGISLEFNIKSLQLWGESKEVYDG